MRTQLEGGLASLELDVRAGKDVQEEQSEGPELEVEGMPAIVCQIEFLRLGIAAIAVDFLDYPFGFALGEEVPRLVRVFGEVDKEEETLDGDDAGDLGVC